MKNKINSKGFTLLELLVVILIIGILAAIALPQYRFTVGKSKYNNIKEIANNMAQAVERYYLAKTTPPENLDVLDIDIPGEYTNSSKIQIRLPTGETCGFNATYNNRQEIICYVNVFGHNISYLSIAYYGPANKRNYCYAMSPNTNDLVNRICQFDTGKKTPRGPCSYYCSYQY